VSTRTRSSFLAPQVTSHTRKSSPRYTRWRGGGHLEVPVIGVAKAGWDLDQLRARAKDSLEKHGGLDPAAFEKLMGALRYIDGDYQDSATFTALRHELNGAKSPAQYLAIPPVLFETVIEQLAQSNCAHGAESSSRNPLGTISPQPRN
jgi:glucose-6-phosphate 1-dehydrogenase